LSYLIYLHVYCQVGLDNDDDYDDDDYNNDDDKMCSHDEMCK